MKIMIMIDIRNIIFIDKNKLKDKKTKDSNRYANR